MAKETFDRSKPHVNIGTSTQTVVEDAAGTLSVHAGPSGDGESFLLDFQADASTSVEFVMVAFPIDELSQFDPASSGDAVSLDFQLEVQLTTLEGTPDVDIAFAIIQGEPFVASRSAGSGTDPDSAWETIGQTGLEVDDFIAVDGGPERPDFSRPFQFGYAFSGELSSSALSVAMGLDNMHVEITTVPEPSSIALVVAMGASLWWRRWIGGEE